MASESHPAADWALYTAATKQRMALAISELSDILRAGAGDMQWVIRYVREQEKVSRRAGFQRVSRMCQGMAECAGDAREADRTWLLAVAATLLDTCRAIEVYADGIAECSRHFAGEHVREPKGGTAVRGPAVQDEA